MATTARDAMTSNCTLPDQLQSIYPNRVRQRPRASTNRTRHVSDEIVNVLLYVVPQHRDTYFVVILGPRPAIRNVHECCIGPMAGPILPFADSAAGEFRAGSLLLVIFCLSDTVG